MSFLKKGPVLRYYSWLVSFSVLLLILKGALVTSNDAGLSVPDWPTSYGENMFLFPPSKWTGIIFYEHVHRLLASFVGFLTLVLTIWVLLAEKRKWVKVLSVVALLSVILQGILGGLTVLYLLPPAVSSAHAVLAQTFFIITIIIAYSQSSECGVREADIPSENFTRQFNLCIVFLCAVYLQLVFGAFMRHTGSGLAVTDFPTMGGKYFPDFSAEFLSVINKQRIENHLAEVDMYQVVIHLLHRFFALVVCFSFVPFFVSMRNGLTSVKPWHLGAKKLSVIITLLLVMQLGLGIYVVLSLRNPWIASFHVMIGALILGLGTLTAARLATPATP